jgi:hypothetical protein
MATPVLLSSVLPTCSLVQNSLNAFAIASLHWSIADSRVSQSSTAQNKINMHNINYITSEFDGWGNLIIQLFNYSIVSSKKEREIYKQRGKQGN